MASTKRPGSGGQRRRRPPTVIDLEATEVESERAAAQSRAETPAEQAQSDPPPPAEESSAPRPEAAQNALHEQPAEPPPPEPPPDEPPEPPPEPPPSRRRSAWLPEELSWTQASAGIAGAAGGLLVFLLLWLVGAFSIGREPSPDLGPRLASIEKQLGDLAARPAPVTVDPKAVDALAARMSKVEAAQATRPAPATDAAVLGRVSAMERAVKATGDNVTALSRRNDAVDAALRETQNRLEKLSADLSRRNDEANAALRELQARLDKTSAALTELRTAVSAAVASSDGAVRLAVAAAALRAAVERGGPFATELAVVKPLASDAATLAPLEPFAASGVPSDAALARELTGIVRPMVRAAGEPTRDAGILERLQANAQKLVRIRPVDGPAGDDRNAILARVERRAADADVSGAIAEIAKLPPAARGPLQGWMAKVEARKHAIEASRRLAADAVAALKATP